MDMNLLLHFSIGKDVFHGNVKFSQVVFSPSISIPADTFNQWDANQRHVEADLPFWVEVLADGWC